jgi:hypothetical protein
MSQSCLPLVSAAPLFTSKCLDSTADAEQLSILMCMLTSQLHICLADTAQNATAPSLRTHLPNSLILVARCQIAWNLGISHVLLAVLLFCRILCLTEDAANDSESSATDDSEPGIKTRYQLSTFWYEKKPNGMKILHESVKIWTMVNNLNQNQSGELLILSLIPNLPRPIPADRQNLRETHWEHILELKQPGDYVSH